MSVCFQPGSPQALGLGEGWAGVEGGSGAGCQHAMPTERPRSSAAPPCVLPALPWGVPSCELSGTGLWLRGVDASQRRWPRSGQTRAVEGELGSHSAVELG